MSERMNGEMAGTTTRASQPAPVESIRRRYLAAIESRDAKLDGAFVYGVRSTGVYCRPSCPSRRPRVTQIMLFANPAAAEQAGFRSCKRCRPAERLMRSREQVVHRVRDAILARPEETLSLQELANAAGLSPAHLQRTFREAAGISPREYADSLRTARFKSELRKGKDVTTALHEVNYGSTSRLYEKSDERLGMTPATYKKGGLGMKITYTIAPCTLGQVLVAGTDRGVSAVYLGDRDSDLVASLRNEYPNASIERDAKAHSKWVGEIVRNIAGTNPELNLPTDVVATAFQRRVWEALRAIPSGATRTYTQVASAIGRPKSVRAVARACATNPTSIVVPCHRVVRTDGTLAGYRWGVERKKKLIEREKSAGRAQ